MKRILLGLGLIFISSLARSESARAPSINSFVSEGVYIATNVYTTTQSSFTISVGSYAIVLTSFPVIVHAVTINKAGTNSTFEFFNTNLSTTEVGRRVASIDTTSKGTLFYDAFLASGTVLVNFGDTVADVTVLHRIK